MRIFTIALLLVFLATPCFGQITPKVAITYNIDSDNVGEAIGGSIKEDVLGVKNLDLDVLVASEEVGDTLKDDDKIIIKGLSYNYDINESCGIGIGAGISLLDYSDNHLNISETDKYLYGAVSYRF